DLKLPQEIRASCQRDRKSGTNARFQGLFLTADNRRLLLRQHVFDEIANLKVTLVELLASERWIGDRPGFNLLAVVAVQGDELIRFIDSGFNPVVALTLIVTMLLAPQSQGAGDLRRRHKLAHQAAYNRSADGRTRAIG